MKRALAGVLALAAVAAATWLLMRDGDEPPRTDGGSATGGQAASPRRRGEDAAAAPRAGEDQDAPSAADAPSPLDALRAALAAGGTEDAPRAAAALRHALRTDPAVRTEAEKLLVAPDTPAALRQALALVLGTIAEPDPDALLLDAMTRFPDDAEFARACLLALGATREPEDDDDVFDLGDRPWGAHGPAGIGITVKREIGDVATRTRIEQCLSRPDARVRAAAAVSLRHSTSAGDVRAAFRDAFQGERDDAVAQELGEALTQAVHGSADASERDATLTLVLARAGEASLDGMRFRVEDDLAWNVRWTALSTLAAKADPAVARAALETARGDADRRVASRAAELLAGLSGR